MSVDLEAIAQRGRCDVSSLRLALPLLEQGYSPPFLARYRRDELGGLDEATLWSLEAALRTNQQIAARREELSEAWSQTSLADPAIGHAIKKANSQRMLARLSRRLKSESRENASDSALLAVRLLNPLQDDPGDPSEIAAKIEAITDAPNATENLDHSLATRLAGDPRLIGSAVRWLAKHARIHIATISDPHGHDEKADSQPATKKEKKAKRAKSNSPGENKAEAEATVQPAGDPPASGAVKPNIEAEPPQAGQDAANQNQAAAEQDAAGNASPNQSSAAPADAVASKETAPADPVAVTSSKPLSAATDTAGAEALTPEAATPEAATPEAATPEAASSETVNTEAVAADEAAATAESPETVAESTSSSSDEAAPAEAPQSTTENEPAAKAGKQESAAKANKPSEKQKKISPRQRRRRWLVGVLKPLEGKRLACDKLSSFEVVMLGRGLRSQVAQCTFEYDATKLVAELQRVAAGLNRSFEDELRQLVLEH
ncbi:MAG: Tex-like N-terminal domain-containing protein [Rubripirellula sp.]|nr:Tex-like N-terminal domain-containing protein [Rubripirellula sp.]